MTAPRAHIATLFLRLLGLTFAVAFISLLVQVPVLYGHNGLLPVDAYLAALGPHVRIWHVPTIFWLGAGDRALQASCVAGALLALGLVLNIAPRYVLILCWALYLSFVSVGEDFLSFQWDNLLLETALCALFLTPPGLRPRPAAPHPIAVFLVLWLVFRLHVESGLAKLLSGDHSWRDLTALVSYYETAPLPTWLGWYVQQLPLWFQRASCAATLFVELVVPLCIWGPRRLRTLACGTLVGFQVVVLLTANYGIFNYLSIALCLFLLDDGQLRRVALRAGIHLRAAPMRSPSAVRTAALALVATALVIVSCAEFTPLVRAWPRLNRTVSPLRAAVTPFRSINAYHLFASMTVIRREVVIEGSSDGDTWQPYEFRYKPGDPARAPLFVAPHQPRVDFQLWFLLLGGPPRAPYFSRLLQQLFAAPAAMAPLFANDPFPDRPPNFIRVAVYRYTFTSPAERKATGNWWHRELQGYSRVLTASTFGP